MQPLRHGQPGTIWKPHQISEPNRLTDCFSILPDLGEEAYRLFPDLTDLGEEAILDLHVPMHMPSVMLLIRTPSSAWSRAGGFEQHALQNKERHAKTPKTIAANTTRSCRGWVSKKCLNHLPLCLHDCNCHTYLLVCLFIYYVFYTFGISFMNKLWIVNIICMSLCLFVLQILNIHKYI